MYLGPNVPARTNMLLPFDNGFIRDEPPPSLLHGSPAPVSKRISSQAIFGVTYRLTNDEKKDSARTCTHDMNTYNPHLLRRTLSRLERRHDAKLIARHRESQQIMIFLHTTLKCLC